MKKTLIALAVLAASGASFAQVTISGNLTMGYDATTTGGVNGAGSADSAGFGVDTSEIDFVATEDLGAGWKVTANMALAGADRSGESNSVTAGGVTGRNASLALQTNAGVFTLASTQAADYLSGTLAGVGAYYGGWNGKVLSARTNRDVVSYTLPVGAFTLAASYQETSVAANQGLGKGTTGAQGVTGQSLTTLGASYAAGPIAANFTYLNFNAKESANATRDQTRLSGNYDLGVAKIGAGVVLTNMSQVNSSAGQANAALASPVNGKITDLLIGASVPMGAVTFGAEWVSRKYDDFGTATALLAGSGTVTGTSLQVSYALSKRTSLIGNYARWTQMTAAPTVAAGLGVIAGQDASSEYTFLVSHSF